MALRFTPEALIDISEVDKYLTDKSWQGLANVLASLKRTFSNIEKNFNYGRPAMRENVRVAAEPRYKYVIPYYVKGADVWILRVYHSRRAPLDFTMLELP